MKSEILLENEFFKYVELFLASLALKFQKSAKMSGIIDYTYSRVYFLTPNAN